MRRAWSVIMTAAFLVCLAGGVAAAQDKSPDTMDLLREKVRADKKLVVVSALELSDSEAQAFWPVYNAYQSAMIGHYDRVLKLIETYAAAYQTMNDEKATQLLSEFLAVQTEYVAVLNEYSPRFQRVLPPRKVARFYQVENKLRAAVDYDLARSIPLMK